MIYLKSKTEKRKILNVKKERSVEFRRNLTGLLLGLPGSPIGSTKKRKGKIKSIMLRSENQIGLFVRNPTGLLIEPLVSS